MGSVSGMPELIVPINAESNEHREKLISISTFHRVSGLRRQYIYTLNQLSLPYPASNAQRDEPIIPKLSLALLIGRYFLFFF